MNLNVFNVMSPDANENHPFWTKVLSNRAIPTIFNMKLRHSGKVQL
ncbi:hypothetical protein F383_06757 [Gossypium arboreum]|uniref:Uncharacterized protein n=1 Tax=Gossypium arboreum TaxID=29729 RepID=A0A0B0PFH2_GOSAR|nr:hypothetical protein F383_06757 [Gossypium arboreum]